jgi:hypothetical protein
MAFLTGAFSWLLGSALGRKVAAGVLIALAIAFGLYRVYAAGAARERAKQAQATLQNLRNRMRVDDEIASMSPADRRKRLSEWVSD